MVKLGILDYAQIDEGMDASKALQQTVELAQLADELGFERFWLAEHHNVPTFASSSPELLMMHLANATKRIRLGSGGVMLPHYSPFKVAENFRMLEALHPGRIDLGLGNNVGTRIVNRVLNENKTDKLKYEESIRDLTVYLTDQVTEEHRFYGVTANPKIATVPEMFVLSMSVRSAKTAAKYGIGYTYGHFLAGIDNFSQFNAFPSVDTARNYKPSEKEKAIMQANRSRFVVGDVAQVKEQLDELITQFNADEVLLVPLMPGIAARKKALELLANVYL